MTPPTPDIITQSLRPNDDTIVSTVTLGVTKLLRPPTPHEHMPL